MTEAAVLGALGRVVDPCSAAMGTPLSLVDMGLVTGWAQDGDHVRVTMCLTGPGCTLFGGMVQAAERELRGLEGVASASVEVDVATVWTEARLTARGAGTLAAGRARRRGGDDG